MLRKLRICAFLALLLLPAGCAPGVYRAAPHDYYTGPGSVPPSWYDHDPAFRHWYEPWYENPYKQ
jgi:hypothetical protein